MELLPDVHYSSITVLRADGTLATSAPTDDVVLRLDAEQYRLKEGPCYDAASHTNQVVCSDLALDERFPSYGEAAASLGVRSQIGVRLFDTPKSNGALNLYSRDAGAFDDSGALNALFAHQAGQAIDYARHVGDLGAGRQVADARSGRRSASSWSATSSTTSTPSRSSSGCPPTAT